LSKESKAALKKTIADYISESQRLLDTQTEVLSARIKDHPVAIWGMGADMQRQVAYPIWKNVNIVAAVDRDPRKQGKVFAGIIIQSPEEGLRRLPANTLVVIAAIQYAEEIKSELAAINANLPFLELRKNKVLVVNER
jgi:hypothetical protein